MQEDPKRQWFVFYNEREIGPIEELEVMQKLKNGEFDNSAYVYTEGMNDWELAPNVGIFSVLKQEVQESKDSPDEDRSQDQHVEEEAVLEAADQAPEEVAEELVAEDLHQDSSYKEAIEKEGIGSPAEKLDLKNSEELVEDLNLEEIEAPLEEEKLEAKSDLEENDSPAFAEESFEEELTAQDTTEATPEAKKAKPASPKSKKLVYGSVLMLLLASLAYYLWGERNMIANSVNKIVSTLNPESQKSQPALQESLPDTNVNKQSDWQQLMQQRLSESGEDPPFFLSLKSLSPNSTVLMGAISSLIQSDYVWAAVYPDERQNLMLAPKIWYLKLPVVEGLFTLGPLHQGGQALSPGIYHVMIQALGKYLGKVAFEVGPWPEDNALKTRQEAMVLKREELAQTEWSFFKEQLALSAGFLTELKDNSYKASSRKKSEKALWNDFAEDWRGRFIALMNSQYEALSGPLFFFSEQRELYVHMNNQLEALDNLNILRKGGELLLQKEKALSPTQLWQNLTKEKSVLDEKAKLESNPSSLSALISADNVKQQLLELK